jgi:hypothetical protein
MSLSLPEIIRLLSDSSEEEMFERWCQTITEFMEEPEVLHGGSLPGKRGNVERHHQEAWDRIYCIYWGTPERDAVCTDEDFRGTFRVSKSIFLTIHDRLVLADPWFDTRTDAKGKVGSISYMKVLVALRMLATGDSARTMVSEYSMSSSQIAKCFSRYVSVCESTFQGEYLRPPNLEECNRISATNASRGFPGCLGSIDCMHLYCRACPALCSAGSRRRPGPILLACCFWVPR